MELNRIGKNAYNALNRISAEKVAAKTCTEKENKIIYKHISSISSVCYHIKETINDIKDEHIKNLYKNEYSTLLHIYEEFDTEVDTFEHYKLSIVLAKTLKDAQASNLLASICE